MSDEQERPIALEVTGASVAAIADAVLAVVDDDLRAIAAAHVQAEIARIGGADTSPQWLSAGDVARKLGVHQRTIYRALSDRRLTGVRVGSTWRIRPQDVDVWLAKPEPPVPTPIVRSATTAISFRSRVHGRPASL